MYVNAKMIPVKLFQEWGCVWGIKGDPVEEVSSSMMYLIHCKNFYKCYSVPPPNTTIKKNDGGGEFNYDIL
jgi:hypothetical protein